MTRRAFVLLLAALVVSSLSLQAGSAPVRARTGMVVSQSDIASEVGFQVIKSGGNAIDAAVATAFALAVTHPTAGNIGGGGFIVFRPANGRADLVRLPRGGAGRRQRRDVAEGRQVRLRPPSQQPPLGRRARHGGRAAHGVEGRSAPSRGRTWSLRR